MINLKNIKNPMPEQDPIVRTGNFDEVAEGFTPQMAINEAMRCLKCRKKPCTQGCPINMRIPEFVAKVAEGEFEEAYEIITDVSAFPRVCGRVCPQENQCEGSCVKGAGGEPVSIGALERFVADWHEANAAAAASKAQDAADEENDEFTADEKAAAMKEDLPGYGHKVAVVGAGPAGLACAEELAVKGYDVTVFDSFHKVGGILAYGIPEFRLPKSLLEEEIEKLKQKGIEFVNNAVIGENETVDDLLEKGYEAVFVGTGAGVPASMRIPGEDLEGVYMAHDYLRTVNMAKGYEAGEAPVDKDMPKAKRVAVIGGGNVAMDASRCAKRMGAEKVYLIYRRSVDEMPARKSEIHEAEIEGIEFQLLKNPVSIKGDKEGRVKGIECVEMELGEQDASGRRRPVEKKGSNFVLDVDCVIMAIGSKFSDVITGSTENLELNEDGGIFTDESAATSRPGIFAGGDGVTGPATVTKAMRAGKTAAASIDEYIMNA